MGEQRLKQGKTQKFDDFLDQGGQPDVWHVAHTPSEIVVHHISGTAVDSKVAAKATSRSIKGEDHGHNRAVAHGDFAQVIRTQLGFPEDWNALEGWNSALTYGEPHPSLMARARVVEVAS